LRIGYGVFFAFLSKKISYPYPNMEMEMEMEMIFCAENSGEPTVAMILDKCTTLRQSNTLGPCFCPQMVTKTGQKDE
jgi:hypothetical protein